MKQSKLFGIIAVMSLTILIGLVSTTATTHASTRIPMFSCGTAYDQGCTGGDHWSGTNDGVYALAFYNQETPPSGVNTFIGVWAKDTSTSGCTALSTGYCYLKAGVVHFGSAGTDYAYTEVFMAGYAAPVVNKTALVANDLGNNCGDRIYHSHTLHNFQLTVQCATTGLNETFDEDTTNINDMQIGLQVIGANSGSFSAPENDITGSAYNQHSTGTWVAQTIDGSLITSSVACASWKTHPAVGNNGGSLHTDNFGAC